MEIRVPQLAEGVETATVVSIGVTEGGAVAKDQIIVELESNKAVASVPSLVSGSITKIHIKEGDEVKVGQVLMSVTTEGAGEAPTPPVAPTQAAPAPQQPSTPLPPPQPIMPSGQGYQYQSPSGFPPPASPSIRKMANELGVDLTRVRGSEKGGRITLSDLRSYIAGLQQAARQPTTGGPLSVPAPSVDFSKWGPVTRKKISSLRKTIAQAMFVSWTSVPRVTQFDDVDITDLMALRKKHAPSYEKKGTRLTLTPLIIQAVVSTLKKNSIFNSSLDEATQEIVMKDYFNIGIAVDTDQGLIVPVIKNADKKSLLDLSLELAEIAKKTRDRSVSAADLQGGTFTISNQGGIGGAHFTPIVNKPEVAILGVGQGGLKPAVINQKISPRLMVPLGLSYDHRVIDGAQAARFIKEFGENLKGIREDDIQLGAIQKKKKPVGKRGVQKGNKNKKGKK